MTETKMTAVMDHLVAGARASRDGTFNTLDALERRTRAASDALAARIHTFVAEHPADPAATTPLAASDSVPERDARFDPEDWEVTGPQVPTATPPPRSSRADDEAEAWTREDYPETWLR